MLFNAAGATSITYRLGGLDRRRGLDIWPADLGGREVQLVTIGQKLVLLGPVLHLLHRCFHSAPTGVTPTATLALTDLGRRKRDGSSRNKSDIWLVLVITSPTGVTPTTTGLLRVAATTASGLDRGLFSSRRGWRRGGGGGSRSEEIGKLRHAKRGKRRKERLRLLRGSTVGSRRILGSHDILHSNEKR